MTSEPIGDATAVADTAGRRSVGRLLLLMGVAVSTVIVLLSVLLSFRLSSEDAIVEDMRGVIEAVSNETVANTESFLAPAERSAEELSRLLERGRLDDEVGLPADELFFDILRVNETFDGIFVGRSDGSFTYVIRNDVGGYTTKEIAIDGDGARTVTNSDHDEDHTELSSTDDPLDPFDPRTRPWFDLALEADGTGVWTAPYVFFSSGLPGVTRAQAVPVEGGEDIVVGIDIRLEALSTFMGDRQASPNGGSFILDRQRSVVAYSGEGQVTDSNELASADQLDDPPVGFVSELIGELNGEDLNEFLSGSVEGQDYQFAVTSLTNNPDWIVAVTAPDDDFLARVRDEQTTSRSISAIGGAASVLLLAVGGLVVNNRYRRERGIAETALSTAVARAEERDATQERLAHTVDELARSNADLEEYAYATAHDLRTPLRAIGGYAELILREVDDDAPPEELVGYAGRIVDGYERMCLTMDNLLEHARASVQQPVATAVALTPIADRVARDFDEQIIDLNGEVIVGDLGSAAVDPIAMGRIFQNLVSNALKYRHPDRDPRIEIASERSGSMVAVQVRDNGSGIAQEHQEEVFRLFNRLSNEGPGTGVGLALVKKLVESHDGQIELESDPATGTIITITLPAEPSANAA